MLGHASVVCLLGNAPRKKGCAFRYGAGRGVIDADAERRAVFLHVLAWWRVAVPVWAVRVRGQHRELHFVCGIRWRAVMAGDELYHDLVRRNKNLPGTSWRYMWFDALGNELFSSLDLGFDPGFLFGLCPFALLLGGLLDYNIEAMADVAHGGRSGYSRVEDGDMV